MEPITIDGSHGEGGGQILRSAVTLSCVTGTPVRITKIRHNRRVPGLRAQHLAAVGLVAKLCNAAVSGLDMGSSEIMFRPHAMAGRTEISLDVGTAGSISLILQAAVLSASLSGGRARLSIMGGTDVPWSPTMDYTGLVLAEALKRFGIRYSVRVRRRGYYPRGGGKVEAQVEPCADPQPVSLTGRACSRARLLCTFSKLDREAVAGQCARAAARLESEGWDVSVRVAEARAADTGSSVLLYGADDGWVAGADGLWNHEEGRFGVDVAGRLLGDGLGTDRNLADMLVIPASRCSGMSVFRVGRITKHLETNLYVASKITGCRYGVGKIQGGFEVRIRGVL